MAKKYTFLLQARADLSGIIRYIADDNPNAAKKMKALIVEACQMLGETPYIGQVRADLTDQAVRFWPVHRSYVIIYNPDSTPIHILRIYNTSRDINTLLVH